MIIIGELLNSTRKRVRKAIKEQDAEFVKDLARKQETAGADYLDVNAGAFATEEEPYLEWLIKTVREVSSLPLCIDSPKPEVLETGCELAGDAPLINSISAEEERFRKTLPLVKKYNASVIALVMDDEGLTDDEDRMFFFFFCLIDNLTAEDISPGRIFVDCLVRPVSTNSSYGSIFLNLISRIREKYPEVHFTCGLSNVSFGLPKRKILNRAFVLLSMSRGLDAAILDPLDAALMSQIKAAEALLGRDEFCMDYIAAARSGMFDDV